MKFGVVKYRTSPSPDLLGFESIYPRVCVDVLSSSVMTGIRGVYRNIQGTCTEIYKS